MEVPQRVTPVFIHVLSCLQANPQGVHGYAIIAAGPYANGAVYPVLRRLADAGWAAWEWDDRSTPRRRVYRLTSAGAHSAGRLLPDQEPVVAPVG